MYKKNYDVVVVGGGLSGVAAAIAASRDGAEVLLLERYGYLGGMAVSGLVNPFMPYWQHDEKLISIRDRPVNTGLFREITKRLDDEGALLEKNRSTFHEEYLKLILDRICDELKVTVRFHVLLTEATLVGRDLKEVTVSGKGGYERYRAKYFIDATGDADLTAFSGLDYKLGRELDGLCQPMTLCFRVTNVDVSRWDRKQAIELYKEFRKAGKIRNIREDILTFPTLINNVVHFNSTRIIKRNPIDPGDLTYAEKEGRIQVHELFRFMKENVKGFENASLLNSAPEIGVRESRRIAGDYTITEDDLLKCKKFDDSIARGTYTIDIHNPEGTGTVIKHIPANDYYTIPLRATLPTGADNLMVAGRPLSSTHEAHSSFRVMPITTCVGEGVGIATALALKNGISPREVSSKELHVQMDKYDALY